MDGVLVQIRTLPLFVMDSEPSHSTWSGAPKRGKASMRTVLEFAFPQTEVLARDFLHEADWHLRISTRHANQPCLVMGLVWKSLCV
jgi:hypothetical protein